MSDIIIREFRSIYKSLDDLQRRVANSVLSGKVAEIDGKRIRLELLPHDSRTGKPFLSPWVQLQEAAGVTTSNTPVRKGDPMRLLSPNGEIGPQSLAIRDSHTSELPNPAHENEFVLGHDGAAIRMSGKALILELGDTKITLADGRIATQSDELTHNEKNVGDTHVHGGIDPGNSDTSTPH